MFKVTGHFEHEIKESGKDFTETSTKVELQINRVQINGAQPVMKFT